MRKWPAGAAFLLALALVGAGCTKAPSDQQIAANIKTQIAADPHFRGSSLKVAVKNGVATLSGHVPSVAVRYEAFKLTSQTAGVKKVEDKMAIEVPVTKAKAATALPPPAPEPKPEARPASRHRANRPTEPAASLSASSQMPEEARTPEAEPQPAVALPAPGANAVSAVPVEPAPPPVERITIPQGMRVDVRMIDSVNSAVNHTGDILHAALAKPIKVGKQLVAPTGADVYLQLVENRSAGHFGGRSELRLELYRIVIHGKSYALVSNDYVDRGASRTKRSVLTILGSGAVGAAIGAIAGGGKGAAIGAAAGGGAGAVYQGATGGKQVDIAAETLLKFKLAQPISVTLNPDASQPNPEP